MILQQMKAPADDGQFFPFGGLSLPTLALHQPDPAG
jgi:hypothetical protein